MSKQREASMNEISAWGRPTPEAVVFFDGACPLCRREIGHYRRLRGADRLLWVDISGDPALLADHHLDYQAAMARFHVLDSDGHWQTGAWGFAELWSHLPGYRWMARAIRGLHLLPLLDRVYTAFSRWRLQRRCVAGDFDPSGRQEGSKCSCTR